MKTAVVTGAGGFIGGALTRRLLRMGCKVYGADRNPGRLGQFAREGNFVPVCVELKSGKLAEAVGERVDTVFYLAWGGELGGADLYDTSLQIRNAKTAVDTMEGLAGSCGRFLFFSSSYEAMRDTGGKDIPLSIYGSAKRAAADMCASIAGRNGTAFNKVVLTNTFGPGDRSAKAVNTLVRKMLADEPLTLVEGENRNDWVYIDDCISGILAVAERGKPFKEYYVGHREITTFREKVTAMRDVLCPGMELRFGGMEETSFVDYSRFDLDALYNDTGFECGTDFKEGIMKTAEYIRHGLGAEKSARGGVIRQPDMTEALRIAPARMAA